MERKRLEDGCTSVARRGLPSLKKRLGQKSQQVPVFSRQDGRL